MSFIIARTRPQQHMLDVSLALITLADRTCCSLYGRTIYTSSSVQPHTSRKSESAQHTLHMLAAAAVRARSHGL